MPIDESQRLGLDIQVRGATGWDLVVADDVVETQWPTVEDIRLLRDEIDKVRLYLR